MALDPVTGSLLMGTIGNLVNVGSTVANNATMLRNAAEARAFNLQMARMQNEYNSPVNQVSRLVAAGMNPHQAFGGSSTPAAAVGEVTPPRLDAPFVDTTSMMNAYLGNALQSRELDYKFAALDEQAREFNILEGIEGHGSSSGLKDAQRLSIEQQTQFNNADRNIDRQFKELALDSSKLDYNHKKIAYDLEEKYMSWRNDFSKMMGSYQLTEANYKNLIYGHEEKMKGIDAKLYDYVSDLKKQILEFGVEKSRLENILLITDKSVRDEQLNKLRQEVRSLMLENNAKDVHLPWLDYSFDMLSSVVSMVTSFLPFAGGGVRSTSFINPGNK